ncbi:MAG: LacI family DNA-binding transcriptional regulator [Kineosporiaceae bacterium]|jgi:DNA-binding LacI/PurR family transcriptional regulator
MVDPMRREPTMADIAARLGVSRQLVSLALRGAPGASTDTRRRVLEAAAELGYRPHAGARTMRQSVSRHLGVVFTPTNMPETDIVEGIYAAAAARGYNVLLSAQTPGRSTEIAVDELLGYRCAAVVVVGPQATPASLGHMARRSPVPLVAVGAGDRGRWFDVVRSAGDLGIAAAVRHLAALGHRRISYVDPESMRPAALRLKGYLAATAELGLQQDVLTVTGDYIEEAGAEAGRRLIGRRGLPTAVVVGNDQAALGLLLVLERAGIRVPEQVSVTGYDDARLAGISAVALTTLRQDPLFIGAAAVEAAVRRIRTPALRPALAVVDPTLVVRGSTGPPRPPERKR